MESIQKFIFYIFSELQSSSSLRNGLNLCTGDFVDKTKLVAIEMACNSLCFTFSSAVSCEFLFGCNFLVATVGYSKKENLISFEAKKTEIGCFNFYK